MTESSLLSALPQRIDPNGRRSRAVVHGDTIHFAGQVADNLDADATQQMQETLARIDCLLAEAGSARNKVLTVTIWLRDMADYDAINAVWDAWVDKGNPPGRACAQVIMADPRIRVELLPVAAL